MTELTVARQELVRSWCAAVHGVLGSAPPDAEPEPADPVAAAGAELLQRWAEPHRTYHNLDHLRSVLAVVDEYATEADDADLVRLAAWGHDAVYAPTASDNEVRSAELVAGRLAALGLPAAAVEEVRRLVLVTAGHRAEAEDRNAALLCDADLAVLGRPPQEYDGYARAVRREYAHLPPAVFRAGRAHVVGDLLARPVLYRLAGPAARWTEPARANLRRELAELARC